MINHTLASLKASHMSLFFFSSSTDAKWLLKLQTAHREMHDKQYRGWMSAKCAANRQRGSWTELVLYFRIRPLSFSQHRSLIPLLVWVHSSTYTLQHANIHATTACVPGLMNDPHTHTSSLKQARTHTHTHTEIRTGWKMHAVNFQLSLFASFLTFLFSPHKHHFSASL